MDYVTPEIEVMGAGSVLVQAFYGPLTDWGAFALSLGFTGNSLGEE